MTVLPPARRCAALGLAALLGLGLAGLAAAPAHAISFTPATSAELIDAIVDANASPGPDSITLLAGDIVLEADLPAITDELEIDGNGNRLDAAGFASLVADGSEVAIRDLTVENAGGHGIEAADGRLALGGVAVTGSGDSGLRAEDSTVLIADSLFTGNLGYGAELYFPDGTGSATVTGSGFDGNNEDGLVVELSGTASLEATGITTNDNELGLSVAAEDTAVVEISDAEATSNLDGMRIEVVGGATAGLAGLAVTDNVNGLSLIASDGGSIVGTGIEASESAGGNGIYGDLSAGGSIALADSLAEGNDLDGVAFELSDGAVLSLTRVDAIGNGYNGYSFYIHDGSSVELVQSTSAGNGDIGVSAGEIFTGSALALDRSTITGNQAGAILRPFEDSTATVVNSTISGNGPFTEDALSTYLRGVAGIFVEGEPDDSVFELRHSTLVDNLGDAGQSAPGLGLADVAAIVSHSILAGNEFSDLDLSFSAEGAPPVTVEHSLVEAPGEHAALQGLLVGGEGNILGEDPALEPLAGNGGPTQTRLPLAGSPVVDAGDPGIAGAPAEDQRGAARISGDAVDLGAVEVEAEEDEQALAPTGAEPAAATGAAALALLLGIALLAARRRRRSAQ